MDNLVIVTGLPRSGTSMMMKMLEAGGIAVITDSQRQADEDNPNGLFELENVKEIKRDHSWLDLSTNELDYIVAIRGEIVYLFLVLHQPGRMRVISWILSKWISVLRIFWTL